MVSSANEAHGLEIEQSTQSREFERHTEEITMMTMLDRTALTGTFSATLHDIPCNIELRVDQTGCQCGYFIADGEQLEIIGGVPSTLGEFYGAIHSGNGETIAVFRATPHSNGLLLELDLPQEREPMKLANAERIVFQARKGTL